MSLCLLFLLLILQSERVLWDCVLLESCKDDVQVVYESFRFGLWEFPGNGGEGDSGAETDAESYECPGVSH